MNHPHDKECAGVGGSAVNACSAAELPRPMLPEATRDAVRNAGLAGGVLALVFHPEFLMHRAHDTRVVIEQLFAPARVVQVAEEVTNAVDPGPFLVV